jgi:23S rRNA pseudouridine2604 synthase
MTNPPRTPAIASPDPQAEGERLSKRMASEGLASRREADEWIERGWVRVDGKVAVLGQRVLAHQTIEVDQHARQQQRQKLTVLLHKPLGYVSGQAEDGHTPASSLISANNRWAADPTRQIPGLRTLSDSDAALQRSLAPAGRLDVDSTGLLVLTQDGRIARILIGEDSDVEKEYLVKVQPQGLPPHAPRDLRVPRSMQEADLSWLRQGLWLDGQALRPAQVSWANEDQLRFVLREGRKRQIRRMCELVGLRVVALRRVRIGRVSLGALPPGQWRLLSPSERF